MLVLAKYIPSKATKTKNICVMLSISPNIKAARTVAVMGCISNPMEPSEAEIFPIPCVIKYWPPI